MSCRKGYYSIANENSSERGTSQWARVKDTLDKAGESEEERIKMAPRAKRKASLEEIEQERPSRFLGGSKAAQVWWERERDRPSRVFYWNMEAMESHGAGFCACLVDSLGVIISQEVR